MKERPISYSPPMVRARRAGLKTKTRRVVKDRHINAAPPVAFFQYLREHCPYGQPGDQLWVREAWRVVDLANCFAPREITAASRIWYESDAPHQPGFGKYRPGMFMPRWASRSLDEIVSVRVERLQDISEADGIAEGIEPIYGAWRDYQIEPSINHHPACSTAIDSHRQLPQPLGVPQWTRHMDHKPMGLGD